MEDRGVIIGRRATRPTGSTLDYTRRYLRRDRAHRAREYPEFDRVLRGRAA